MSRGDLIGCWSDLELYQGSMESCELVFLGDGSGWYEWSNFGGAFEVLRLQWKLPAPDQLAVLIQEYLGGTWTLEGLVARYRVERQRHESKSLITGFRHSRRRGRVAPTSDATGVG